VGAFLCHTRARLHDEDFGELGMLIYGVVGAGGFGREIVPLVREGFEITQVATSEVVFVVEDEYPIDQPRLNGHRVISMSQFIEHGRDARFTVSIGRPQVRQRIAEDLLARGLEPFAIAASSHVRLDENIVGPGAVFCHFSHVTSNARVGKFFHCNIYSYVAHDCSVGDYVTFAPGVKCNGHVVIEDLAYIGAGAVIKDASDKPIVIGRGAIVGAGAVVTKSVPPGAVVVGSPARPM
jgi:sugar O-acyltransferase (sialic acid O-acetyltransferase NeuD family)